MSVQTARALNDTTAAAATAAAAVALLLLLLLALVLLLAAAREAVCQKQPARRVSDIKLPANYPRAFIVA